MFTLFGYICSIIIAWILFRTVMRLKPNAKENAGIYALILFIPAANIILALIFLLADIDSLDDWNWYLRKIFFMK